MAEQSFMRVEEVVQELGVSKSYAYKIVQKLNQELKEKGYLTINSNYGMEDSDRLFPYTKYFFEHELKRGIKLTGLHKIRVHDTRHSHAAHLIHMGASPLQIRDRLGHEDIKTTLNTYGHLYPNTDQKMAEQLESEYREEMR